MMFTLNELLHEVEQLPINEKWQLVNSILRSLEQAQTAPPIASDWQQFLRETYGSLRDTPLQRWDQGDYEEREPFE
ncbi:MAG: hypothetical protein JXA10_00480 [Anaerolineae bacterium]|nr:hypothetical protein [Anaerolineae bacterium]